MCLSASNVSSHSAVEFSEHNSPRISLPAISRLHLWSNFISSSLLLLNSCNTPTLLSESPSWSSLGSQSYRHPWTPTTGFLLLSVIVFLLFSLKHSDWVYFCFRWLERGDKDWVQVTEGTEPLNCSLLRDSFSLSCPKLWVSHHELVVTCSSPNVMP